jgi:hypothetical protein
MAAANLDFQSLLMAAIRLHLSYFVRVMRRFTVSVNNGRPADMTLIRFKGYK